MGLFFRQTTMLDSRINIGMQQQPARLAIQDMAPALPEYPPRL